MSTFGLTFDQFFLAAVAVSSVVMVCSGLWIVRVLIQIEKSKVIALSSVLEDDGTGNSDLQFEESTSESGGKHLEVESAGGSPSGGDIELSPTGSSRKKERAASTTDSSSPAKPTTAKRARRKLRRVSWQFINIQIASVLVLMLLTYLLLVQSTASVFLRMLGSLCVYGVFLRFQIGEELRRQRVDRIMLLLSLFLLIASMLSTLVYSFKQLNQGEIYEGPARIVGYSQEHYNNTKHDPTTRADVAVSWGKDWGCPWSGGVVCQANIEGAMCQSHPAKEQTKHKPNYDTRRNRKRYLEDKTKSDGSDDGVSNGDDAVKDDDAKETEEELEDALEDEETSEEALEEDLEDEEKSNQELEEENENLSSENEMLQKEIEELQEQNEVEDEENDELVDQENSELNELADEYNEELMIVEEDEYEDAQAYVDYEYEEEEDSLEDEIASTTDDGTKEELTEELEEDQGDQAVYDEEYEEDEEILEEYADEYADLADEDYNEFVDEQDTTYDLEEEKDEIEEEVEETEEEINEMDSSSSSNGEASTTDDLYEEMAEDVLEEEEEEEEMEEGYYDYYEDDWYWDEYPSSYDDDLYEDEYWDYDWDSVWGDYACEDLFDADIGGQTFDPNTPAGGDDEWPFVNIYGSCKTCDAYVLDYFAEEAFESTQEFKIQAVVYLAGAMSGFIWTLLSYIKYKVSPTSENEIELLGSDGGVLA